MQYLIWSKCHSRDLAMWWALGGSGYTTDLRKAGRFTMERATELVGIGTCARAENILIPEWEALGLVNKLVVETGQVFSRAAIMDRLPKAEALNQEAGQ